MPSRYRSLWLTAVGVTVTVGTCVGILVLRPSAVITFFVSGALIVGLGSLAVRRDTAFSRADLARTVCGHGLTGGASLITWAALGALSGPALAVLMLLGAATSPWAVQQVLHAYRSGIEGEEPRDERPRPTAAIGFEPAPTLPAAVQALTDRELCRAWGASYFALREATDATARHRIVCLRHVCLDEFERRKPVAMRAWLATVPRAAGSPAKLVFPPPSDGYRDAS